MVAVSLKKFFFQAEDGIRDVERSRGLGDVYKRQTYGRKVTIHNDHEPLEAILKKPLAMAPKRLRDIMIRWNRYKFDFVYVKGSNLTIADSLSRAYLKSVEGNFSERLRILSLKIAETCDVPDARFLEIREATEVDNEMQMLKEK